MHQHRILVEFEPSNGIQQRLQDRLSFFSVAATGIARYYDFAILLKDENDAVQGGLLCELWANWLHFKTLDRRDGARQRLWPFAHGTRGASCHRRGYKNAYLSTHGFQARPLYEKLGYRVFGELEDFPPGHFKDYMRKQLA